jgi:hypothetical protein
LFPRIGRGRVAEFVGERAAQGERQLAKLGEKAPKPIDEHVGTLDIEMPDVAERPKWPTDGLDQIRLVRDLLAKAPAPTAPKPLPTSSTAEIPPSVVTASLKFWKHSSLLV